MAIKGVDPKCYILALFVREDGERFLLGSGRYVFKEKQQHFQANKMANDVIEVQGNDGYLLAGQVRRPGTQDFDGYVGDGTSSKEQVEQWRRDFFKFFRKNYLYKVIYVFSDGSAIQRKRGFLVDAPTVEELYQIYPEYHVALNFEDINYYFYNEDSDGNEIYGKSAIIGLTVGATGGLMWDNLGAISLPYSWLNPVSVSGTDIQINNQLSDEVPITDLQPAGDTFQQTYSGKNLWNNAQVESVSDYVSPTATGLRLYKTANDRITPQYQVSLSANTTYTISCALARTTAQPYLYCQWKTEDNTTLWSPNIGDGTTTFTPDKNIVGVTFYIQVTETDGTYVEVNNLMIEQGSTATTYEPYVGGIPSPNPDYPQAINVVTGEQTVKVTGKNLFDLTSLVATNITVASGVASGTATAFYNAWKNGITLPPFTGQLSLSVTAYTDGNSSTSNVVGLKIRIAYTDGTNVDGIVWNNSDTSAVSKTYTTDASKTVSYIAITYQNTGSNIWHLSNFQIEQSASPTPYEPYQSTTKTINLGSTELAKIGTYVDGIFNNDPSKSWYNPDLEDNAWYVHKENGKIQFDGNETVNGFGHSGDYYYYYVNNYSSQIAGLPKTVEDGYCSHFKFKGVSQYIPSQFGVYIFNMSGGTTISNGNISFSVTGITTSADFKTWLGNNKPVLYHPLATPTDTKITDATLIGQLEGLEGTKLFIGENNVLVTANGSNLPATLSFKYYTGINYDGAGFEWEPGGSGGDDMITVDSIDDVYPMLTIPGPVVNPTITNVTTGSVFQYTGTLSSTQTLEVDLMAKTAFLNGVSVIANVTSSSLYFKSGTNRVSYATNNADAPDATIKWQEIVG